MVQEPSVSYLVCALPRSGSSLLCELLTRTGVAGSPLEYFHVDRQSTLTERWGARSVDDYLREVIARRTGPNGVFGMKVHWGQYEREFGDRDPRTLVPNARFVQIFREDHVRQAVSWTRAVQTDRWSTISAAPAGAPAYDREAIDLRVRRLARGQAAWRRLFERHGVSPLRVTYERLVEAREQTVRELLEFLGIDLPPGFSVPEPTRERQADAVSEQWVRRYLAESGGTTPTGPGHFA